MSLSAARLAASGNMPYVGSWLLRPRQPMARKGQRSISLASNMAVEAPALQYEAFGGNELSEKSMSLSRLSLFTQPREKAGGSL